MAKAAHRSLGPNLSKAETIAGFCYLPFYLVLLSVILSYGAALLGITMSTLTLNVCYFTLNTIFIWIIFRRFLISSFRAIHFWELVQAVILGFALYYASNWLLSFLVSLLNLGITSFNDMTVQGLAVANRWVTIICTVLIAPVVEETLVRGLVFGSVRRKNRILAYIVSILLFSLMHVWQYVPTQGIMPVLLAAVQYIPASIALGWTYEKAGTIWAPIFLHMIINGIGMSLL